MKIERAYEEDAAKLLEIYAPYVKKRLFLLNIKYHLSRNLRNESERYLLNILI